jgi:hypothetical protein
LDAEAPTTASDETTQGTSRFDDLLEFHQGLFLRSGHGGHDAVIEGTVAEHELHHEQPSVHESAQ